MVRLWWLMLFMLIVVAILDIIEIHIMKNKGKWPKKKKDIDQK